jgi:hypothetical protein
LSWFLKFDERIAFANGEALRTPHDTWQHAPALPKAIQRQAGVADSDEKAALSH